MGDGELDLQLWRINNESTSCANGRYLTWEWLYKQFIHR